MATLQYSSIQSIPLITHSETVRFDDELRANYLAGKNGEAIADAAFKNSQQVRATRIVYTSNKHAVVGFMIEPLDAKGKLPCIIVNRGGSGDFGKITKENIFSNLAVIAAWGYIVIASQYSGNDGSEGKDEFGGADLEDIFILYKILQRYAKADTSRIGMYGASRGGMMTYMCLARVKWIKAAITVAGIADLFRNQKLRPEMKLNFKKMFGGKSEDMKKRSAVYWVNKFSKKTPVLMLHGSADWRVSPEDSLDMSREMLREKIPHRFVLLEGADHGLTEFRKYRFDIVQKWFDRFVKESGELPNLKPHGK
ncbi:prolyl oligopeptidase family serine peptidase [Candidatus Uhrbacteria bacterium]|nr:prolyl oligopeptidase family serine peptidase [Candidatus Uhrbacteria bacterium]